VGKNDYLNGGNGKKRPAESILGSDAHKEVMCKMTILTPDYMAETWLDYFTTKPRVKVLNEEQALNAEKVGLKENPPGKIKKTDNYCIIKLCYKGHLENLAGLLEEVNDIAKEADSYPFYYDHVFAVTPCKELTIKNGRLKKITVSDPLKKTQ
jgi:hypothetical protein